MNQGAADGWTSEMKRGAAASYVLSGLVMAFGGVIAPSAMAQAASPGPGTVVVLVADAQSQAYLAHATVTLQEASRTASTGDRGFALFPGVPQGTYTVQARRLGYAPASGAVRIGGDTTEITLTLIPVATSLPTVIATERMDRPWLRDFHQRRETREGTFVTAEEIDALHGTDWATLLRAKVPFTVVDPIGLTVTSQRGPNGFTGPCKAVIYVDGIRHPTATLADVFLPLVGGIEYYSPGFVPVQYREMASGTAGSAACGVLLVWHR